MEHTILMKVGIEITNTAQAISMTVERSINKCIVLLNLNCSNLQYVVHLNSAALNTKFKKNANGEVTNKIGSSGARTKDHYHNHKLHKAVTRNQNCTM